MPGHSDLGMYPAKKEDIDASNTVELDTCGYMYASNSYTRPAK